MHLTYRSTFCRTYYPSLKSICRLNSWRFPLSCRFLVLFLSSSRIWRDFSIKIQRHWHIPCGHSPFSPLGESRTLVKTFGKVTKQNCRMLRQYYSQATSWHILQCNGFLKSLNCFLSLFCYFEHSRLSRYIKPSCLYCFAIAGNTCQNGKCKQGTLTLKKK